MIECYRLKDIEKIKIIKRKSATHFKVEFTYSTYDNHTLTYSQDEEEKVILHRIPIYPYVFSEKETYLSSY